MTGSEKESESLEFPLAKLRPPGENTRQQDDNSSVNSAPLTSGGSSWQSQARSLRRGGNSKTVCSMVLSELE